MISLQHYLDEHFTVLDANDHYYEMIGYSQEKYESCIHKQYDFF